MKLAQFVEALKNIYADKLKSVVLFGSAANNDQDHSFSDYNLIIVLSNLAPIELRKSAKLIRTWVKKGKSTPLFFDTDYIANSTDVFPIEFSDIKRSHKILVGEDHFSSLSIKKDNLRHQCESQLRGIIAQLRSQFIHVEPSNKRVLLLMIDSLSSIISIFKGILELRETSPGRKKREVIEQIRQLTGVNCDVFFDLVDHRNKEKTIVNNMILPTFEQYLTSIDEIIRVVDSF